MPWKKIFEPIVFSTVPSTVTCSHMGVRLCKRSFFLWKNLTYPNTHMRQCMSADLSGQRSTCPLHSSYCCRKYKNKCQKKDLSSVHATWSYDWDKLLRSMWVVCLLKFVTNSCSCQSTLITPMSIQAFIERVEFLSRLASSNTQQECIKQNSCPRLITSRSLQYIRLHATEQGSYIHKYPRNVSLRYSASTQIAESARL